MTSELLTKLRSERDAAARRGEHGKSLSINDRILALKKERASVMTDETTLPEIQVGQALRAAVAAIDDLVVLANREETRSTLCEEKRTLGYILTRAEVLCTFALAVKPGPMLVRRA